MRNKIRSLTTLFSTLVLGAALLAGGEAQASVGASVPALMAAPQLDGKLNVNDATQKQWELLPGIGPATAKKLVDYRARKKFGATNQVMRIKGIGKKTYQQIKPFLTLEGETNLHVVKSK